MALGRAFSEDRHGRICGVMTHEGRFEEVVGRVFVKFPAFQVWKGVLPMDYISRSELQDQI
jgi:hypothetical protein